MLLHESAGFALGGAADGHAIDFNGRNAHAYGNGLSIFAAGADAFIELQIVACLLYTSFQTAAPQGSLGHRHFRRSRQQLARVSVLRLSRNPVSYTHLDVYKRQESFQIGRAHV